MRRAGKKPGRKFRFRQFSHGPRAQGRIWWSRNLQPSFPVIKPQSLLLAAFPPPTSPPGVGGGGEEGWMMGGRVWLRPEQQEGVRELGLCCRKFKAAAPPTSCAASGKLFSLSEFRSFIFLIYRFCPLCLRREKRLFQFKLRHHQGFPFSFGGRRFCSWDVVRTKH